MAAAEAALAPFRVGLKEVYLPNFSITLHRTKSQPATAATFTVPLWFSKLDLRDYLYHAYNVRILSVRSYIKLQRITQGANFSVAGETYQRPQAKRWHRPNSHKRMTVQLERPFVWPDEPTEKEFEAFNKKQNKMYEEEQMKFQEKMGPTKDTLVDKERRESMKAQAKALLEGKAKWKPVADKGFGSMGR